MWNSFSRAELAKMHVEKLTKRMARTAFLLSVGVLVPNGNNAPVYAQESNQNAVQATNTEKNWSYLVRDTIEHEIDAQAKDRSLWCYRKLEEKGGQQRLFTLCQARGAQIERLQAVNGKTLDESQREAENQRIEKLLKNPRELRKKERQQREDAKQAANLLELIPDAFVFRMEEKDGNKIKLKFKPNPAFHPSGHEAEVFHHMEGTLTLDLDQRRLAEISGHLNSAVKFGGGLLGHLDEGGTFLVRQQEVGPGCWEMTTLDVRMSGRALFFKTIDVRQKEVDSEFQAVPMSATIEQVAQMTKDNRMLKTQDEERRRMARELHDSAGQIITALGMGMANIGQKVRQNPPLAKTLEENQNLLRQLNKEIRTMSYLLHPPLLDENGLSEAIRWYTQGLAERSGLNIEVTASENFGRLDADMELAIFRTVQECLTNIHRHSGSKTAMIRLSRCQDTVSVEVQDEGKGIPEDKMAGMKRRSGVGIAGMRERVRHYAGTLDIVSNGNGTKIAVLLPIPVRENSTVDGLGERSATA
jgi:signal transduction histidine kinase